MMLAEAPRLEAGGFAGPLDLLLDLARRRRLDLAALPLSALIGQCVTALEAGAAAAPLDQRGEWLVMASELVLLRSRLLATGEGGEEPPGAAVPVLETLRMRAAAAWLAGRAPSWAARSVRPGGASQQALWRLAFLEALLAVLERSADPPPEAPPAPRAVWRLPEALGRLRRLCPPGSPPRPLPEVLPPGRAALAVGFLAALELARTGELTLTQKTPASAVILHP